MSFVGTQESLLGLTGFVLIGLIYFFLECVLLILNFKVHIFPDWYQKCLTRMTKPFLVSDFHFPACVRKHAGRRSNTQVERFEVDVMIDVVEAKTQHLLPRS